MANFYMRKGAETPSDGKMQFLDMFRRQGFKAIVHLSHASSQKEFLGPTFKDESVLWGSMTHPLCDPNLTLPGMNTKAKY